MWVFYADKGSNAERLLQDAGLEQQLLGRSRHRRAKVSKDALLFIDLPVQQSYVDDIITTGAHHLMNSRWLNASAFRVLPEDAHVLDDIAALPFVIEVRPCARGRRQVIHVGTNREIEPGSGESASSAASHSNLNYGPSLAQLEQIGATVGHDSGYSGEGVILAMFDTGFRTSHDAFATAFSEGRVVGERDYVQDDNNTANEGNDPPNQWSHGTLTWSTAGSQWDNNVYGPAYGASFVIAKTEVLAEETLQEEFDWIAAMEWADSLGAEVISSSLVFNGYPVSALDGSTVVASIAIGTAADLGIVVCNGAGNSGPGLQSIVAPADAYDMLAIGAVDLNGTIANFSSRGPPADGRIKPAVCARGVTTYCANSAGDNWITTANGTSLATPLAAGVCAQLIQARPTFSARLIMRALKETASNAGAVNNTYGHGILNLAAALQWGVRFTIDGEETLPFVTEPGIPIQFADVSDLVASSWNWTLGDGDSAVVPHPSHSYSTTGLYDVSLSIQTSDGEFSRVIQNAIVVQADTVSLRSDTVFAGQPVTIPVHLRNTLSLEHIQVPLDYSQAPITFDSVSTGLRTAGSGPLAVTAFDSTDMVVTAALDMAGNPLASGQGEVLRFYFTVEATTIGGTEGTISIGGLEDPALTSGGVQYAPHAVGVNVRTREVLRGDANGDGQVTSGDIVALIGWIFKNQSPPPSLQSGDANADLVLQASDAIYLVNYVFKSGPAPPFP